MKIIPRAEAIRRRLTKYRTGQTCIRGHLAERWVVTWTCIECAKEHRKKCVRLKRERRKAS